MVTLPPRDSSTQPLIGRVAVPRIVTTAVAPSLVPVSGTTDHAVMPGGIGVRARCAAAARGDGLVGEREPVEHALRVGGPLVQGIGCVERGRVGGVEQAHARELGGRDVDRPQDEKGREDEEPEDENPDLALFGPEHAARAAGPRTQPTREAAPVGCRRPHRAANRSTVATCVDEIVTEAGRCAAMKSGTRGRATSMVAVDVTSPSGRRHGEPSHVTARAARSSNEKSAKATEAATRARPKPSPSDVAVTKARPASRPASEAEKDAAWTRAAVRTR